MAPENRVMPNLAMLVPETELAKMNKPKGTLGVFDATNTTTANDADSPPALLYEDADLPAITRRQMEEDLAAYRYDLNFCQDLLSSGGNLTAQEIRTLQIRILDGGHNIRHCRHRIERLDAEARGPVAAVQDADTINVARPRAGPAQKRRRVEVADSVSSEVVDGVNNDAADDTTVTVASTDAANGVQRLGRWDCRLCKSRKYLTAGNSRLPLAPPKWPLKDVSKMMNHFLDLHVEHTAEERCAELGDALDQNRGPFEYWLTRTKKEALKGPDQLQEYIDELQGGNLPDAIKNLSAAGKLFPNTSSQFRNQDTN